MPSGFAALFNVSSTLAVGGILFQRSVDVSFSHVETFEQR